MYVSRRASKVDLRGGLAYIYTYRYAYSQDCGTGIVKQTTSTKIPKAKLDKIQTWNLERFHPNLAVKSHGFPPWIFPSSPLIPEVLPRHPH
jgi:hypothetical protein